MTEETWKIIPFAPEYDVSSLGRIFSWKTGKYLKPFKDHKGYARIAFMIDGKSEKYKLHRVVACMFVPNPQDKLQVAHFDGDRMNAAADNLRWVTQSENEYDKPIFFKASRLR